MNWRSVQHATQNTGGSHLENHEGSLERNCYIQHLGASKHTFDKRKLHDTEKIC